MSGCQTKLYLARILQELIFFKQRVTGRTLGNAIPKTWKSGPTGEISPREEALPCLAGGMCRRNEAQECSAGFESPLCGLS